MVQYKPQTPPRVKEIITPSEFLADADLVEMVVDEKMMRVYVQILFICSLLLSFVVII